MSTMASPHDKVTQGLIFHHWSICWN